MFGRKIKYEVVNESDYTDFSDRQEKPSPSNGALLGTGIAATASLTTLAITNAVSTTKYTNPTIPPTIIEPTSIPPTLTPTIEPVNVLADPSIFQTIPVNAMTPEMIPTGFIAETSLSMLATVLDPLIQILVAISFPIASVIMVGACFFFMLGNSEKAWQTIFNAGLGYVLVQMSPLFLNILKGIGKAM